MKKYFSDILHLFASGRHTQSEENRVWHWLTSATHREEKDASLRELYDEGCEASRGSEQSKETTEAWGRWLQAMGLTGEEDTSAESRQIHWGRVWRAAAAILLVVTAGGGGWLLRGTQSGEDLMQQYTPLAQQERITLPDGTAVQLNAGSTLIYPRSFTGPERAVYLLGEANFKVAKDKHHPFRVKGEDFQVTALGTEFNVTIYPEATETRAVLLEGSVCVDYDNMQHHTLLQPGEELVYDRHSRTSRVERPDLDDATAWQRGELVFRSATVGQVLAGIERRYGIEMSYSPRWAQTDHYSFRFRQQATLQEVMNVVSSVVGNMRYEIHGGTCRVSGN